MANDFLWHSNGRYLLSLFQQFCCKNYLETRETSRSPPSGLWVDYNVLPIATDAKSPVDIIIDTHIAD